MKCWITFGGELRHGGIRILNNLKRYAPSDIEFVDTYEECDFVIMHLQYKSDLDWFLHNCKKPFVFLISELQQSKEYFKQFFSNPMLKMTYTFHPLEVLGYTSPSQGVNHVWAPWGVEDDVFNVDPVVAVNSQRKNTILTFGFYDSEHYTEIYDAVRLTDGKMVHLDFKVWDFLRQGKMFDSKYHWYAEYVPDDKLKELYLSTKFVSGLRSGSGFEVSILEGMLMGCRPICFDSIYYRKWFNDFALFIPEGEYNIDMSYNLIPYFRNADSHSVTIGEIEYVKDKFGWKNVAENFWKEIVRSI